MPPTTTASRVFTSAIGASCRRRLLPTAIPLHRAFSSTPNRTAQDGLAASLPPSNTPSPRATRWPGPSSSAPESDLIQSLDADESSLRSSHFTQNLTASSQLEQLHRLHVFSTKRNTHITLVQPQRSAAETISSGISSTSASAADQKKQIDVLMSLSTGNIGFTKAGRGSYDAAYQLASFVLKQVQEKGIFREIHRLEVVLRGFGPGREAVTKVLLGTEGQFIRGRITSVVDATRLKQGGPRSPKPRRL